MREGGALSLRRLRIKETDPHEWHFRHFRPLVSSNAPYTLKPGGDKALDHRRASACPKIMSLQWESRVSVVQVNRPPPPVRHHRRVARPDVRPALRGVGFTGGVRY